MKSQQDWKLPPGTSRGTWDYVNDSAVATGYDKQLGQSSLFEADLRFAHRFFTKPGAMIDLGCGTGRLLFPFVQRGASVLGVDLSPDMLRVTAAKAQAAGLSVALARANLVELDCLRDACFDYAACLFSTLGMISGVEHRRRMLAHAYRILKPGGRLLVHVHNRWFHLYTRAGRHWLVRDWWRALRGAANAGDYDMPAHHGIAGLALHHFSCVEIVRELRRAGFRIIEVEPLSLRPDCRLPLPWLFPGLRAYGFLVGAERPAG